MSSGYDRPYDNSNSDLRNRAYNPNIRDPPYSPDPPYYNRPNDRFNPQEYPAPYPYDHHPTSAPFVKKYDHVGDFTPFYIAVTICAIIGFFLFVLNIALGCCSRYSGYWNDRHTGNRWIVSLWTATPHKQPALDYSTELQEISSKNQVVYHHPHEELAAEPLEVLELRRTRESEI